MVEGPVLLWRDLEDNTLVESTALVGNTVEVAGIVEDESSQGVASVIAAGLLN